MSEALVHIGTHKTGTTAFQEWADRHQDALLARSGIALYDGLYGPSHYELTLLCLRPNRTMRQRWRVPESVLDEWRDSVRDHIAGQVALPADKLLISAESLSFLRYEDEVAILRDLLTPRAIQVAVCLRDPTAFLESYRYEMERRDIPPSRFAASHNYVEPDTWLTDWDGMLSVWRDVLGEDRVTVFSYEEQMARHRSSIPGVLEALSIDDTDLPSWTGVTANTRAQFERSFGSKITRTLARIPAVARNRTRSVDRGGVGPMADR